MSLAGVMPNLRRRQTRGDEKIKTAVLREFNGGWNVVDNELNLDPKYAKILDNFVLREDSSLGVRQGTKFLVDIPLGDVVLNMVYFQDYIVCAMKDGTIYRCEVTADGLGTPTVVWNTAIAAALPGAPSAWTNPIEFASFATFNGQLIACNGIDKPLLIDFTRPSDTPPGPNVEYLQDLATSSNANTPICKYITTLDDFVIMAGDPVHPGRVYISNKDTSGTWSTEEGSDPTVGVDNNAVYRDIDKYADVGENYILGLATHRNRVVVAFENELVFGTLGQVINTGGVSLHEPDFDEVLYAHGAISHRAMINTGDDLLSLHVSGVTALSQAFASASIEPLRASTLIDPAIQERLTTLTVGTTTNKIFAVHDLLARTYMVFVPNFEPSGPTTSLEDDPIDVILNTDPVRVRVRFAQHRATIGDSITLAALTAFNNMSALNGTYTVESIPNKDTLIIETSEPATNVDPTQPLQGGGTVATGIMLQTETVGFVYQTRTRKEKERRAWSRFRGWNWNCGCTTPNGRVLFARDNHIFLYGSDQNSFFYDEDENSVLNAINWIWEEPWVTFKERMKTKIIKHVGFDTLGTAPFTCSVFVDNFYSDLSGELTPVVTMDFVGGERMGYGGGAPYTSGYGGGRITSAERLYAMPVKGKLLKWRFEGSTTEELRFIALHISYLMGNIRR